ncbi:hypothetical protein CASFOL_024305 [Castilleja foliolosa]|uniref:Uncharacterized protein n=1 Tax=Castilleja foliolosa TaxID=1961234 RepID=A0ABD3CPQ5_9LAMI
MDFHLPQELYATSDYVLDEFEHEHDDDVFYRELREQMMQLTAEDEGDDVDDEEICENKNSNMVAAKQGLNNKFVQQNRGYYNWPENKEDKSAPTWILNLWRNGNGTGVFIPQIVPSHGKNRRRKRKGRKGRTSKKVEEN